MRINTSLSNLLSSLRIQKISNLVKLLIANLFVLALLLITAEGGARIVKFGITCFDECEFAYLRNPPKDDVYDLGLTEYDPILGYVPKSGFDMTLSRDLLPFWYGSRVKIIERGIRANENKKAPSTESFPFIAVGDSFTFGDQVSNNETWPACLERLSQRTVHNAGVSGYGSAQALLRLEKLLSRQDTRYGAAILSVVVGHDFDRDRLAYRCGVPRPAVVGSSLAKLHYAPIPDPNVRGSKFAAQSPLTWYEVAFLNLREWSWLMKKAFFGSVFENSIKRCRTEMHKDASPQNLIIQWTLGRFKEIRIPKIMVLQYEPNLNEQTFKERDSLLFWAKKYDLTVVDTLDVVHSQTTSISKLYRGHGHHTPLGNEVVCKEIWPILEAKLRP